VTVKQGLISVPKKPTVKKEVDTCGAVIRKTDNKLLSHHEFIFGKNNSLESDVVNVNSDKDFPMLGEGRVHKPLPVADSATIIKDPFMNKNVQNLEVKQQKKKRKAVVKEPETPVEDDYPALSSSKN
jgi:hypothetical protein